MGSGSPTPSGSAHEHDVSSGSTLFAKTKTILVENTSGERLTCEPSIYTMYHPKVIVSNQKEDSISSQRVKGRNRGDAVTHRDVFLLVARVRVSLFK